MGIVLGLCPLLSAMPYNPFTDNLLDSPLFQQWNNSYTFNPQDSSYSFLPFNTDFNFELPSLTGDNLGFQTRTMSKTLITALKTMSYNPAASQAIEQIFADESICLNNIEELIQAAEEGTQLVELAEPDLLALRALDPLVKKIAPNSITVCNGSPDSVVSSLLSLTSVIKQLSVNPQVNQETRQTFSQFSDVVSKVTSLVGRLRDQTNEFKNFCSGDKKSSADAVKALGDIIKDLTDMTSSFGTEESAEAIKKGNELTANIAAQLEQMKDID